jgi:hypothetical protein
MTESAESPFVLQVEDDAIVSLQYRDDVHPTEYIKPGERLGDLSLWYRHTDEAWTKQTPGDERDRDTTLQATSRFTPDGEDLLWTIDIENTADHAIEVGGLGLPLPMHDDFVWDPKTTAQLRVFCHHHVAAHGSFFYWLRPNSASPYLLMTPEGDTALEFWGMQEELVDRELKYGAIAAYPYSKALEEDIAARNGSWRQPHTSLTLDAAGQPGSRHRLAFRFQWVESVSQIRNRLYEHDLFDIEVVPGMTVPSDMSARIAIRCTSPCSICAEFPDRTTIKALPSRGEHQIFEVAFEQLGENLLEVTAESGKRSVLEFFATEPVRTLIEKRAAFLVDTCQHRDPSQWWNGLVSDWNMKSETLLDPEHLDTIEGWREYMASCDDPGLAKAPFVALKNMEYPVAGQIEALDAYIDNFVWGKLQMNDEESHPFGIYGIPNWKRNRDSQESGAKGKLHIWRIYDYPHIAMLYWAMYRIAQRYPTIPMQHPAEEYLRRAAGTAIAMFVIPMEIREWNAYKTGLYNELIYTRLIADLRREGMTESADELEGHWHKKIRHFIQDDPSLFGSEYAFDSTGFESMHEFARYAVAAAERGDSQLGISAAEADAFMSKEIAGNIFCRGWLETAYYTLGSDLRADGAKAYTLSYMSQMSGWALLDYALYHAEDPFATLRLAYASALSSWALMNSGTPQSDYGYWFPGKANDGGAGGGFEPAAYGTTWLEQPHGRGAWYYGCEIELGFSGALRCARTIIADDPIFGLFCFGGTLNADDDVMDVIPRDGLNRRLHILRNGTRCHLSLERDAFSDSEPVRIASDLTSISFVIDSQYLPAHETRIRMEGLPSGDYRLDAGTEHSQCATVNSDGAWTVVLPLCDEVAATRVSIRRSSAGTR